MTAPGGLTLRDRACWLLSRLRDGDAAVVRELLDRIRVLEALPERSVAEPLELATRLMDYRDQVLLGFRHMSRLDEAQLIQAAIDALRAPAPVFRCKCGRVQNPPAGVRQWRCDCGAMTFIAGGGR